MLPDDLVSTWRAVEACARHGAIVVPQAANTGLTGGSTPSGDYDRPVVVVSTERIGGVFPISEGSEAVCLAGSTLTELEAAIRPFGRTPHSIIGSSCIGASVVGGICNNSGGALVQRGPAVTDHALYARIDGDGELQLVDELGLDLRGPPEEKLAHLDAGRLATSPSPWAPESKGTVPYAEHVRKIEESTPSRYNADPRGLRGISGSAGKALVMAVRVATFPAPSMEKTFLLGSNSPDALARFRTGLLGSDDPLPTSCEYMRRNAYHLAISHGNDVTWILKTLGAGRMPAVLTMQKRMSSLLGNRVVDRAAQTIGRLAPHPLIGDVRTMFDTFEHILIVKAADEAIAPLRTRLEAKCTASSSHESEWMETGEAEGAAVARVRFAAAAATVRFREVALGAGPLVALDIALPRNRAEFSLQLPEELDRQILARAEYGHFLCNVFHLDFVLADGVDPVNFEKAMKDFVESMGGRMPAEHSFGHLYPATPQVEAFYRELDPTNSFNPGIGLTSRRKDWA